MLVIAAASALAQVPRTINYQGRINDASGPLGGTHNMTLKIWDQASGGATPLYSETQPVTFRNGVFTVAIGGGNPNGITATIKFDKQYWLGVTIAGINGGQELAPRFILRTSPYSFRSEIANLADSAAHAGSAQTALTAQSATHADKADQADSAKKIIAPAVIVGLKTAPGLHVTGSPLAIVSNGVDSVSKYLTVGDSAGSAGTPVAGSLYRDNVPLAWAQVDRAGALQTDFGIASVTWVASSSSYEVTLDHPAVMVHSGDVDVPQISPVITIGGQGTDIGSPDAIPATAVWSFKRQPTGQAYESRVFLVRFYQIVGPNQGQVTQRPFTVTVFGRTQ